MIKNTDFLENYAGYAGAGVYLENEPNSLSNLLITNLKFIKNLSQREGAAINFVNYNCHQCHLSNLYVKNNTAITNGIVQLSQSTNFTLNNHSYIQK